MTTVIDYKSKQVLLETESELDIRAFVDQYKGKCKVIRGKLVLSANPDNSKNYCARQVRVHIGKGTGSNRMPKAPKGSNQHD